jgi:hypothetical protein
MLRPPVGSQSQVSLFTGCEAHSNGPRITREREGWRGVCRERSEAPCRRRDTQARRVHTLVRWRSALQPEADHYAHLSFCSNVSRISSIVIK